MGNVLPQLLGAVALVVVHHAEDTGYLDFRLAPEVVLGIGRHEGSNGVGVRFAEVLTRPRTEVIVRTVGRDGVRVPRIAQDEVDGQFLRLEVAYVDNPQVVDARLVGKVELFAELRDGRSVHPTVVPRASVHVDVVVEPHAAAAIALLQRSHAPDITSVVVAEEQEHVVGHGEALVIVALHLGEDGQSWGTSEAGRP